MNRNYLRYLFAVLSIFQFSLMFGQQCTAVISLDSIVSVCQNGILTIPLDGVENTDNIEWFSINEEIVIPLIGNDSLEYLVPTQEVNTISYYAIVDGSCYTDTITVNIIPINNSGMITTSVSEICSGDSIELVLSDQNGSIELQTSADGIEFVPTNFTGTAYSSEAITNNSIVPIQQFYRVVTSNEFCPSDTSELYIITVYPESIPGIISSSENEICSGNSINLNLSNYVGTIQWQSAENSNPFSYIEGATSASIASGNIFTTGNVDQYNHYFAEVTSGICPPIMTDTFTLTIHPRPEIQTPQIREICSGDFFEFAPVNGGDFLIPEETLFSYTFTDNPLVSGENSGNALANVSDELFSIFNAIESVTYNVTPSNEGCTGSPFTLNVILKPAPNLVANDDLSICEGETTGLNAVDLVGIDNTYFYWTSNEPLSSVSFPYISNPLVAPVSSAIFIVEMFNPLNGCSDRDSVLVSVSEYPQLDLLSPSVICGGEIVEIQITGTSGLAYAVSVNNADLVEVANQVITISNSSSSDLVITVSGENEAGCISTVMESISVGQIPNSFITGPEIVCANSYYQEYSIAPTSNALNWQVQNGEVFNGQGTNHIFVHWYTGESGSIVLNESDVNSGCTNSYDFSVTFSGLAPNIENVELLVGNLPILFCANSSFDIYKWGYTTVSTNQDFYTGGTAQYYNFGFLDVANYFYWVEHGFNDECLTRSYYNTPPNILSIEENSRNLDLKLYPNPVEDFLTIDANNLIPNSIIQVLSSTGNLIDRLMFNGESMRIDVSSYAIGVYFVRVIVDDFIYVIPVVKQ